VALVDLDVVKPYFRSRAAREFMAERGVAVVAPTGEFIHADLPIIVPEIRGLLRDPHRKVLMDVGGDDSGARVVGSLRDVVPVDDTEHLLVLNFRRPFTDSVASAVAMVREIEAAARLPITGVISNTHLMSETTPSVVVDGYRLALETARQVEVPVVSVAVEDELAPALDPTVFCCPVFAMSRIIRPPFGGQRETRRVGPLFVLN